MLWSDVTRIFIALNFISFIFHVLQEIIKLTKKDNYTLLEHISKQSKLGRIKFIQIKVKQKIEGDHLKSPVNSKNSHNTRKFATHIGEKRKKKEAAIRPNYNRRLNTGDYARLSHLPACAHLRAREKNLENASGAISISHERRKVWKKHSG